MKNITSVYELHEAGKMRIEDLLVDSQSETGACLPTKLREDIEYILNGEHKTFRYMLMTGLLVSITDAKLNPCCLQVSAKCEGAFDARSFCQKVIVPFEKTYLKGRLGNSNEPYANKPARFEMITRQNKVRNGKDRATLFKLCDTLEHVKKLSGEERESVFKYALHIVLQRSPHGESIAKLSTIQSDELSPFAFFDFLEAHTKGESAVSLLYALLKQLFAIGATIVVHPATESGASSNEVGDIDVKFKDGRQYAIEVKDKVFTKIDVDHACGKAAKSNVNRVIYAVGSAAENIKVPEGALLDKWAARGVELTFLKVSDLLSVAMAVSDETIRLSLLNAVNEALLMMTASDLTMKTFNKVFKVKNEKDN